MCPIYVLDFHRRGIVTNMPILLDEFALNGELSVCGAILESMTATGRIQMDLIQMRGPREYAKHTQYVRISRIAAALPIKRNDGGFR